MKTSITDLIDRAIKIAGGSQAKLASRIGVSQNAIYAARKRNRVTAEMAIALHQVTKGRVKKSALRPDLFEAKSLHP